MPRRIRCSAVCVIATAFVLAAATSAVALPTSGSDLGPASLPTNSGDPNLGVANQPDRTFNFDNGWRFKLVNTERPIPRTSMATRTIRRRPRPASPTVTGNT
jgi:hypothetical protein